MIYARSNDMINEVDGLYKNGNYRERKGEWILFFVFVGVFFISLEYGIKKQPQAFSYGLTGVIKMLTARTKIKPLTCCRTSR